MSLTSWLALQGQRFTTPTILEICLSLLADDGFTKNPNLHQDTQYLISVPKIKFSMQSIHRGVKMYDAKLYILWKINLGKVK